MTEPALPSGGMPRIPARRANPPPAAWMSGGYEPSLESLLADPVLLAVLARNRVTVAQLRELSNRVGDRLSRRGSPTGR